VEIARKNPVGCRGGTFRLFTVRFSPVSGTKLGRKWKTTMDFFVFFYRKKVRKVTKSEGKVKEKFPEK